MLEIHASGALILKNDQISVLEVQTAPVLAFHLFGGQALQEPVSSGVVTQKLVPVSYTHLTLPTSDLV